MDGPVCLIGEAKPVSQVSRLGIEVGVVHVPRTASINCSCVRSP